MRFENRIRALEQRSPDRMLILCTTPDGEKIMPIPDAIKNHYGFIKVVRGADMCDLDMILNSIYETAVHEVTPE